MRSFDGNDGQRENKNMSAKNPKISTIRVPTSLKNQQCQYSGIQTPRRRQKTEYDECIPEKDL